MASRSTTATINHLLAHYMTMTRPTRVVGFDRLKMGR